MVSAEMAEQIEMPFGGATCLGEKLNMLHSLHYYSFEE